MISLIIATDGTDLSVCQSTAALAILYIGPGICDGACQLLHLVLGHIHNVKSQALG